MIHFAPYEPSDDNPEQTRELYIEGTDIFIGEIRQGRKMTNLRSKWTEWAFFASESGDPAQSLTPVEHATNKGIGEAYHAARTFAAAKYPEQASAA